ncbi:MAG TPA: helix-turn-helix transcriptional regulator [Bacteroidia bacterium]|nr:helix-turn-helix transcriptional regulator [Bacteroidia bacterium]
MLPKKDILQKAFGNHVKELRLQKGLTQIDVSSRMDKDQQSLQRVESGNVSPSLYYLFELASGLDVSVTELLDFKTATKKKKK